MGAKRTGLLVDGARKKRWTAEETVATCCEDVVLVEAHVRFCAIALPQFKQRRVERSIKQTS